jgi:hypothetical protein
MIWCVQLAQLSIDDFDLRETDVSEWERENERPGVPFVWLCLWPSVTDGSQPLIGRVMCEHYCLSVLMYTPGMTVMSLLLNNRYESKRSRDFLLWNRKYFSFCCFPEKEFLCATFATLGLAWDRTLLLSPAVTSQITPLRSLMSVRERHEREREGR